MGCSQPKEFRTGLRIVGSFLKVMLCPFHSLGAGGGAKKVGRAVGVKGGELVNWCLRRVQ